MDVDDGRSPFMVPQARRALYENQEPKPKALPQPHVFVNEINQSMLSLLISLYRKHFPNSVDFKNAADMSGIYQPRQQAQSAPTLSNDVKIAYDVVQQIRQLLDEIYDANDSECRRKIDEICEKMKQLNNEKGEMTTIVSTKETAEREKR
uniref:Uncharacterized protein n=1 Tax=Romanomermis culicivorax TaxID=13658 RepID=A0A915JFE2_ROMCU